jgi:hypothetical protein
MAHFARLGESILLSEFSGSALVPQISGSYVSSVLVVSNDEESRGEEFLSQDLGLGGTWIQTSYNTIKGVNTRGGTPLRKNYGGIGYIYDYNRDAFIPPLPYNGLPPESGSWVLNENECWWYYVPSGSLPPT